MLKQIINTFKKTNPIVLYRVKAKNSLGLVVNYYQSEHGHLMIDNFSDSCVSANESWAWYLYDKDGQVIDHDISRHELIKRNNFQIRNQKVIS